MSKSERLMSFEEFRTNREDAMQRKRFFDGLVRSAPLIRRRSRAT
jgi:hypothetical protein